MKDKVSARIKSRKKIAKGTFKIDFNPSEEFDFVAGQHTGVWLPKLFHSDPKGNFRLFSICSSPNNPERISITFRDRGSGFKKTLLEIPAGLLDVENENPEDCALRELQEETGYSAGYIRFILNSLSSPGILSENMQFFMAKDLTRVRSPEDGIKIFVLTVDEILNKIAEGEIVDGKTILAAFFMKGRHYESIRS